MKTELTDTKPISLGIVEFTRENHKYFIVRYRFHENGNIVYQFFAEDPEGIEAALTSGAPKDYAAFVEGFKESLLAVFKRKITIPERLDTAYVELHHSYSVLARGYVESINRSSLLTPLFEELDKEIESRAI